MYGQTYDQWVARVTALRDQLLAAKGIARLDLGTQLLNAIGNAAQNTPDATLRARWMAAYGQLRPQVATLRAQYTENPPPAWLRALDAFSDRVLAVADAVAKSATAVVVGVGATARALPVLLPIVAIGLGALYLLPLLRKRGGSRD